jgi:transposase
MPQTNQKVEVVLDDPTRAELETLVRVASAPARKVRQARVLLLADEDRREGRRPDWYIAECVGISLRQIVRIRQQFMREGLAPVLSRKTRSDAGIPQKMDGRVEAKLITLCCSAPPKGRRRWTMQLLADELCRLRVVTSVCDETVRKCLKKTGFNLGAPNASASRSETAPASSRKWRKSSTSITKRTPRSRR